MRKVFIYSIFIILPLFTSSLAFSQKLTVGILSGINFTKPQGEFTSGKWEIENGPVAGLFLGWQLTKVLSVQTEIDYTVLNYTHKRYNLSWPLYYPYPMIMQTIYMPPYYYYNTDENWELHYCRIPLYLKVSTPTKLKLELALGGYYAFRGSYEVPDYPMIGYGYDDMMPYSSDYTPPKHDAGLFYSVGLSYPVADDFNVYINGRYFSGKTTTIESVPATNGAAELTFGLGYTGLFKSKNKLALTTTLADSIAPSLTVTVKGGVVITGNSGTNNNQMYSNSTGFTTGLSFKYNFSKHFALQSELLYERKGYGLKGESNAYYKYTPGTYYSIDNQVDLNYVTIPLLLNLSFGEKFTFYFNGGFYASMMMSARCTGTAYTTYAGETSYIVNKITVNDDIDGFMNSSDWGWALGGGFQYPVFKKYKLDLEYRYTSGFTNAYSNRYSYTPAVNEDTEIKNKALTFSLGIQVPIN